jgi:hypothetical protein
MTNMHDVFCAIRDDESDHVSTMEACLDPTVAKISPSMEKRVLTGVAAAAAVAMFLNTGSPEGSTNFVDGIDFAAEDGATSGIVDAIMSGAAGIASQFQPDGEESALADFMEEGSLLPNIRALVAEFASMISRFML